MQCCGEVAVRTDYTSKELRRLANEGRRPGAATVGDRSGAGRTAWREEAAKIGGMDLGFSHVSARPKAYKQDADAMAAFKKTFPPRGAGPLEVCARHCDRGVVPGRDSGRPQEQAHLSLG